MNGNTWRIAAAVVVVVIGIGAGAALLGGSAPGGVGAPPTASPTATPTPMPFPTGSGGIPVTPGTYGLDLPVPSTTGDVIDLRITFTVGDGWRKNITPTTLWKEDGRRFGFLTVDASIADPCALTPVRADPPTGPTVDDLVAALTSMASVTTADPGDVSLAGYPGVEVPAVAVDGAACGAGYLPLWSGPQGAPNDDAGYAMTTNEQTRIFILDVDGARLVVVATAARAATDAELAELQAVLDSVAIEIVEPAASR